MKSFTPRVILCLTAALLPGTAFAELNNKNNLNVDGLTGCKNDGHTPEERCKSGCGEEKSPGKKPR